MKFLKNVLLLGLATALVSLAAGDARAQGYLGLQWPYSYGYGQFGPAYGIGNIPTPPYFALHPPVYYGQRVSMPYGNSPMTRPPRPIFDENWAPPRQQPPVVGKMIVNPYVSERPARPMLKKELRKPSRRNSSADQAESPPVASESRMIVNPFVAAQVESAESQPEAAGPRWIENPFVAGEHPVESNRVATN